MAFASFMSRAKRIGRSVSAFRTSAVPALRRNAVSRRLSCNRRPTILPKKPASCSARASTSSMTTARRLLGRPAPRVDLEIDRVSTGLDDVPALAQVPVDEVPDLERRHRGPRSAKEVPRRHPTPLSPHLEPVRLDQIDRLEQVELQGA